MSEPSTELSRTVHSGPPTDDAVQQRTVLHDDRGSTLTQVGMLAQEMSNAWKSGHRLFAESFLDRYPELRDNRDAVLRLVCEEISLREQAGMDLSHADLVRRFPRWTVELEALLEAHALIESDTPEPEGGHRSPLLQEFEVLAELGEGAQGQVYLVRQKALANRPLVIKVSPRKGNEHLSLARLQHTGIMPLYWVKDDVENDRRTLCMPYFGKTTATAVLKALRTKSMTDRTGKDILDVLDGARETMAMDQPGSGPVRAFLATKSYVEVVCWIGACLADALEYAHQRGLIHLDIKPSNILLANDGQPMLLDFHLSCPPLIPGQSRPSRMGGTPLYMSPEQHAAMLSLGSGRDVPLVVDGRSDVYSLGVVLYQLLGGRVPLLSPPPRLDAISQEVSCGLADVVEKCLAPNAEDRYATAAALSADLNRHLTHRPLVGVRNRSCKERWRKYRRREPRGLTVLGLLLLLVAGLIGGGLFLFHQQADRRLERQERIASLLADSEKHLQAKKPDLAVPLLEKALNLAQETRDSEAYNTASILLQRAKRGELLRNLHDLADKLRFAAGEPVSERQAALEKACRSLWEARDRILAALGKEADKGGVEQAKRDLLDLAILSSHFRIATAAPVVKEQVCCETLTSLLEAEKALGLTPVLAREIERIAKLGGVVIEAKSTGPPTSAWEHYALGRSFLLEGDLEQAARHLEESLKVDPRGFWPNFLDGQTAYRQNRYSEALAAFRAALVARICAPAYYNRGLVYARLQDRDRAEADYSQAIALDPQFGPAWFARGVAHLDNERFAAALDDLRQSLPLGHDPAQVHYHLALAQLGLKNRPAAIASLQQALRHQPEFAEAKKLHAQLTAGR